jgi:hypothetical protein
MVRLTPFVLLVKVIVVSGTPSPYRSMTIPVIAPDPTTAWAYTPGEQASANKETASILLML